MKTFAIFACVACCLLATARTSNAQGLRSPRVATTAGQSLKPKEFSLPPLPPLPDGVVDLSLDELFKRPVGPKGLEFTDKVKSLAGKRVRVVGFMVREELEKDDDHAAETNLVKGRLLLTPLPETISPSHYGLCDDLPPQTIFVRAPQFKDQLLAHQRKPMLLTGILSLGNETEPDGRISSVRLTLDASTSTEQPTPDFSSDPVAMTESVSSKAVQITTTHDPKPNEIQNHP